MGHNFQKAKFINPKSLLIFIHNFHFSCCHILQTLRQKLPEDFSWKKQNTRKQQQQDNSKNSENIENSKNKKSLKATRRFCAKFRTELGMQKLVVGLQSRIKIFKIAPSVDWLVFGLSLGMFQNCESS